MTNWLKWRLATLLGGAALVGGATYLHAQGDYPAPASTPEEAATRFYRALQTPADPRSGAYADDSTTVVVARNSAVDNPAYAPSAPVTVPVESAIPFGGIISRAQAATFTPHSYQVRNLAALLAQEVNEPEYDAQVVNSSGGQTVVSVAPAAPGKGRSVVVVAEDGGYRVDLKATYARWNNLSGVPLDEAWYRYTGAVSPVLASDGNFLRSQCQSNLKQQMLGIAQYTQDYDEKYPAGKAWMDVVQPYVKSNQVFKCPSLGNTGYGYAFNSKFNRVLLAHINSPSAAINIYETSNLARNVSAPFNGRAYRHVQNGEEGMNIAFADGHVRWFARGFNAPSTTINPETVTPGFTTISTGGTR